MNAAAQQIVATLQDQVAQLERAQASLQSTMLGQGYIVEVEGVYMNYDVADHKVLGGKSGGLPCDVTRFRRVDAEKLAAITVNGNGVKGRAVHVKDAVAHDLQHVRRMLANIAKLNEPA